MMNNLDEVIRTGASAEVARVVDIACDVYSDMTHEEAMKAGTSIGALWKAVEAMHEAYEDNSDSIRRFQEDDTPRPVRPIRADGLGGGNE